MVVRQGDVFWADLGLPGRGSSPAGRRAVVVVQSDLFNETRIGTVVVAITTTMRLAAMPGNVALRKGEANLPRRSVVNVTQIATLDRDALSDKIGAVSPARLRQVLTGVDLLLHRVTDAAFVDR